VNLARLIKIDTQRDKKEIKPAKKKEDTPMIKYLKSQVRGHLNIMTYIHEYTMHISISIYSSAHCLLKYPDICNCENQNFIGSFSIFEH
jgi:hypothetical protein